MKLIDAIRNVRRPTQGWFGPPVAALCGSLHIDEVWSADNAIEARLKAYPIFKWLCTDAHVGLDALYLDGEPVGCVSRWARKDEYCIEWISDEAAKKTRGFLLSFLQQEENKSDLLDPDQDIGEDFSVRYASEALTDDGFYEGRPVKALIWYDPHYETTPEQYRRPGESYREHVPWEDPKRDCVLVQDGQEQRVIRDTEFRIAFNVDKPDDSGARP